MGHQLAPDADGIGNVVTHLYRAEMDRTVKWRSRMDTATNWAVTIVAAILAYAFSNDAVSHTIILVGMLVCVAFLSIEAHRFQRYDVWRSRLRALQENLFADALDPSEGVEQRDWRRQLSEDLRNPTTKLTIANALAHRLRRVYLPLFSLLLLVWVVRLSGADGPIVSAAAVAGVPGPFVVGTVLAAFLGLIVLALWPHPETPTETADRGGLDTEA